MILVKTKNRILQFLDFKNISVANFLKDTSIKRGFLDADKLNGKVSDEHLTKIIATYPDINIYWLLTGRGEMLITNDPKEEKTLELQKKDWEIDRLKEENSQLREDIAQLNKTIGKLESQLEISDTSYKSNVG